MMIAIISMLSEQFHGYRTDKGGMRRAYRASKQSAQAAMASPVSTERLASFQTRFVVLCGILSCLNGSSRHASPCLGDMHMADCRQLPCSQRRCANMRGRPPQMARSSLCKRQAFGCDLVRSGSDLL